MTTLIPRLLCALAVVGLFASLCSSCAAGPERVADPGPKAVERAGVASGAPIAAAAQPEPSGPAPAGRASESPGREKRNAALEIEKKVRELYLARLELDLARQQARSVLAEVEATVILARFTEQAAQEALGHYRKEEAPRLLEQEQLAIDRQQFELEAAQRDLARKEKELGSAPAEKPGKEVAAPVLQRSRTKVEHAERELKLLQAGRQATETYEIPRRTGELAAAAKEKSDAFLRAEEAVEQAVYRTKIDITRAENQVDLSTLELAELRGRGPDAGGK